MTPTARTLTFSVFGKPQQRGSKTPFLLTDKSGNPRRRANGSPIINTTDDNAKSKSWMACVRQAAAAALPAGWQPIRGPVCLSVEFHFLRPGGHWGTGRNSAVLKQSAPQHHTQTPDLAKLVRALEDSLAGIVWADDRQVCCYENVTKQWTSCEEKAIVTVQEMP